jgi:hypothetical protein
MAPGHLEAINCLTIIEASNEWIKKYAIQLIARGNSFIIVISYSAPGVVSCILYPANKNDIPGSGFMQGLRNTYTAHPN